MSQVTPLAAQALVRSEVQRAAARTSIDFDYLLGQASLESSLDPDARAPNSSASGLFQFISSTWLHTLQKHGGKHGLEWASAQIEQTNRGPVIRDPALREQVLALRHDPQIASIMAAEFASDNRDTLRGSIGREPTNADLYLAHFLGPAAASDFLRNMQADPSQSAAALFPKAAGANRSIFFEREGGSRSLASVYNLLETRLSRAINRNNRLESVAFSASVPASARASIPASHAPQGVRSHNRIAHALGEPARASMTDVLRSSFRLDASSSDPGTANVRKAYGVLQAFKL